MIDMMLKRSYVFTPTAEEGTRANIVCAVVSLFCTAFALLVLLLAAIVWKDQRTRYHFKKRSTKLLLACVAIAIPLGLAFASTTLTINQYNKQFCRFGMWTSIFTYNLLNWLQGCISLNLMLALKAPMLFERYKINRIYWIGGISIAFLLATIPLFVDKYGYVPELHSCWVVNTPGTFNLWQLSITEAPLIVVTVLMFVATTLVAVHLLKAHKAGKTTNQLLNQLYEPAIDDGVSYGITADTALPSRFEIREITLDADHMLFKDKYSPSKSIAGSNHSDTPSDKSRSPRVLWRSPIPFSPKSSLASPSSHSLRSPDRSSPSLIDSLKRKNGKTNMLPMPQISEESLAPRKLRVAKLPTTANFGKDPKAAEARELRNTLLRISVYPFIHLVIAVLGPLGSLILEGSEHRSRDFQVGLYYLSLIGTAWIPFAYSCCAVFADVSLYNGMKEYIRLRHGRPETEDLELALGKNKHRWSEYANATPGVDLFVSVQHVQGSGDAKDFLTTQSKGDIIVSTSSARRNSQSILDERVLDDDVGEAQEEEEEENVADLETASVQSCKRKLQNDKNVIFPIKE